jgi:transposase
MKHKTVESVKERGRWSAKSKREAVLKLLRGEDIDAVSRELKVTAAKLSEWREAFLASGMAGLKAREADARDEEVDRLKAVLGEMTMQVELQRDAIRRLKAGLPLDETKLPKGVRQLPRARARRTACSAFARRGRSHARRCTRRPRLHGLIGQHRPSAGRRRC